MTEHTPGRGDHQRAEQGEHGDHDRGGASRQQGDAATDDPDTATHGDRQPGDLVADPERLVIAQRGRRADPAEPVPRQPLEKTQQTDRGDDEPDDEWYERDEMHVPMVSGGRGDPVGEVNVVGVRDNIVV